MRTVLTLTIALALGAPLAVTAAQTGAPAALTQIVGAFQQIESARVVEQFENGALATVDVIPSGQYRVATAAGEDPALVMRIATQPIGDALNGTYNVTPAGTKTIDGAKATGYKIVASDGSYTETVWANTKHLPIQAHVETQGHRVDVLWGDYNDSALVARP
jgi:hypothetical protein